MTTIATFAFKDAAALVRAAFPGARSRRPVRVEVTSTYSCRDYWDGGSREEARFVDLASGRVLSSSDIPRAARQQAGNCFNLPIADVAMTAGFAVIEHSIFCGRDMGYRVHISPDCARDLAGKPDGFRALLTK